MVACLQYAFLEAMVLGDVPDAAFIAQLIANTTRCRMDALDALAQLAQVKVRASSTRGSIRGPCAWRVYNP